MKFVTKHQRLKFESVCNILNMINPTFISVFNEIHQRQKRQLSYLNVFYSGVSNSRKQA